jgi:cytochrome c oxidase subunit 3
MKDSSQLRIPTHTHQTGVVLLIAAIIMVFAGLTSAIVIRQASAQDWGALSLPTALYGMAVLLVFCSAMLELGRRRTTLMYATAVTGVVFLTLNGAIWKNMIGSGFYLSSSPATAMFYLLTGTFTVLLFGAVLSLGWILASYDTSSPKFTVAFSALRLYWHFLTLLWIYILLLVSRG